MMIKVQMLDNLSNVFNKIDMLPINVNSMIAEAVNASESDIKKLFELNDFQNTEIEIVPIIDGVGLTIKNSPDEYFKNEYYNNNLNSDVRQIIINKIKLKFGGI